MTTSARLGRLRLRLTAIFTLTAAVGLVALATVTTVVESRLRADRTDEELIGWASRAASLVDDATGGLDPSAIADDVIDERVEWVAYGPGEGADLVVLGGRDDLSGAAELAALAVLDDEERGTVGSVVVDDVEQRGAAMPLYVGDDARGAVVVAALDDDGDTRLAQVVWAATLGLIALGGLAGWWLAGRSIRPAASALDHREQFLSAAAHELRTPLARVRAVAESASLLSGTTGGPVHPDLAGELDRLRVLTAEATSTVEQLLLIARVDAGRFRMQRARVDVAALIEGLRRDHPAVRSAAVGDLVVDGDPMLLRLALENLVGNAERHGAVDGIPPAIELGARREGATVVIRVADDGPGVPAAVADGLFDRFRSTDPMGTGVGLWLVRWVAEQHAGLASVEPNGHLGGASFRIEIPAS